MGNLFFGGEPGIGRMFGMSMGTEASWLLPAALIGLLAGLWLTRKAARTDRVRASLLLWGGWLLVTAAVFSFMDGTIHPYYTVALAPAIAGLVGISVRELWRVREHPAARLVLAAMSAGTGVWAFVLLDRTPDWLPALRWIVLAGSVVTAVLLAVGAHRRGRAVAVLAASAMLFGAAAPAAYAVETVATPHNGPVSTSGPSKGDGFDFGRPGQDGPRGSQGQGGPAGPGGPGGRMTDNAALAELVSGLDTRWAAATVGSMGASDLELKTGASVMAIGGFTGSDDSPTLAQFQDYVAKHQVRYFIASERFGPPGHRDSGTAAEITAWVKANFTSADVGGATVYDLGASK
jgi:4-amino-4-deoxy-L-arabinose transferase-like glycosyltransferase